MWMPIFLLMLGEDRYLCASTFNCVCGCLYIWWVIVVLCNDGCNCVGNVVIVFCRLITCNRVGYYLYCVNCFEILDYCGFGRPLIVVSL